MYDDYPGDYCYGFAEFQEVVRIRKLVDNVLDHSRNTLDLARAVVVTDEITSRGPLGCRAVLGAIYERLFRRKSLYESLELLEFCVRNCGLDFAVCIQRPFLKAMTRLLKLKSLDEQTLVGQVNSTVKSLIKSARKGRFPGSGDSGSPSPPVTLSTTDVILMRCQRKVLYLIQLWADAYMMKEDRVPDILQTYRDLRRKGYPFPQRDPKERFLIKHAEHSPAFDSGNVSRMEYSGPVDNHSSNRAHTTLHNNFTGREYPERETLTSLSQRSSAPPSLRLTPTPRSTGAVRQDLTTSHSASQPSTPAFITSTSTHAAELTPLSHLTPDLAPAKTTQSDGFEEQSTTLRENVASSFSEHACPIAPLLPPPPPSASLAKCHSATGLLDLSGPPSSAQLPHESPSVIQRLSDSTQKQDPFQKALGDVPAPPPIAKPPGESDNPSAPITMRQSQETGSHSLLDDFYL